MNDDDPAAAAHLHSDVPPMMSLLMPEGTALMDHDAHDPRSSPESCYSCLVMFPILCVNGNTHKFEAI